MLSALQSQQEGLHIPMVRMALGAGTMTLFEAKEDILGNLGTGAYERRDPSSLSSPANQGFLLTSHLCMS